ncbi:MAG: hypothetical protein FWE30_04775 [Bacteroidales bacterium]|nr:hypothetical protein [Bacteroidales bacterium]
MKKNKLILSFCLLFAPLWLTGQFYTVGTAPARVRWRQIEAGPFKVIYPREIDSLAQRYAWLFEKATPHVMAPLQAKTPSLPIVLHPYTLFSNGMVVWAPKRMELYTTPPAASYAQNWEKQLVLHETRHVGQMSKLSQNFFKAAEYFMGQQSQGIAVGGYTPTWILEGDAVLSETEYSFSGRGREAAFLMPYKAYFLDSISFSWDSWRYGSYKYHIPDRYQFGYFLLSTTRYHNRAEVLSGMFDLITKRPYIPFISRIAFNKATGYSHEQTWALGAEIMGSVWSRDLQNNGKPTPFKILTDPTLPPRGKPVSDYADYESVIPFAPDSVYALYRSFNRASSLVRIDSSGKKEFLRYMGYVSGDLAQGGGKLYWTEVVPGLRWEQESFSLLRSFDPKTNIMSTLTPRSRYRHPSVSPLGQTIAVVHAAVTGESALHLLDAENGAFIGAYSAPDQGQIQSSTWASDSLLYAIVLSDSGLGIYTLHIETGLWNPVVPPQYRGISRLHYANGLLYFSSDLNGTDNIYALDPHTVPAQLFSLTHARDGAFSPWLRSDTLYYSNYSYAGLRPVSAPLDSMRWKRAHFERPYTFPLAEELSRQVGFRIDTVEVPAHPSYPSKPYSKAANLFRIHSWAPIYYDVDRVAAMSMDKWYDVASPGVLLLSQNTLSTAIGQLGYSYRNGFHTGHLKFTYQGWYPVIELSAHLNERKAMEYKRERGEDNRWYSANSVLDKPYYRMSADIYIPFNLQGGGWVRGLLPRAYLSMRNDRYYSIEKSSFNHYATLQAGVQYYQYRPMAMRSIFPRWGFGLSAYSISAPSMGDVFGTGMFAQAFGYFPGLFANQGLRLRAIWQQQWIEGKLYYLPGLAVWPRGYPSRASQKHTGFTADYAVPVWLGDLSLGRILYLKRLQLIPFADWAKIQHSEKTEAFYSVGADVLFDVHAFRIGSPISAGFRSAFRADGVAVFEMLFSVKVQ